MTDATGSLEDKLQSLFGDNVSGTGEEELLRLASKFSLQYHSNQIRILVYLNDLAYRFQDSGNEGMFRRLKAFIALYGELKQYNNSDVFVMKALESIALKRFIGENAVKVNVEK